MHVASRCNASAFRRSNRAGYSLARPTPDLSRPEQMVYPFQQPLGAIRSVLIAPPQRGVRHD
jgi:hypothetical protein